VGGEFQQLVHKHEQAPVLQRKNKRQELFWFAYENQILKVFHQELTRRR